MFMFLHFNPNTYKFWRLGRLQNDVSYVQSSILMALLGFATNLQVKWYKTFGIFRRRLWKIRIKIDKNRLELHLCLAITGGRGNWTKVMMHFHGYDGSSVDDGKHPHF